MRGYIYRGRYHAFRHGVIVVGEKGTARFNGFAWGYSGEGPRGLRQFLTQLNVSKDQIAEVLESNWPDFNKRQDCWRIDLTPAETPELMEVVTGVGAYV